eukprot:gene20196-24217_t
MFAEALLSIPTLLLANAGLDTIRYMADLKTAHLTANNSNTSIDLTSGNRVDMLALDQNIQLGLGMALEKL